MRKQFEDEKNLTKIDFCECISRTGIVGEEFEQWTCPSCKKIVFNKNRMY